MNKANSNLIRSFKIKLFIILTIVIANLKSIASEQLEIDKNLSFEIQNFLKSNNKVYSKQNNYYQHYIPFKSIEFHSEADQINNSTLKVKEDSYSLRFKMKSFEGYKYAKEIYNSNNNLINLKNDILVNEKISAIYLNTTNYLLLTDKKNILAKIHEQQRKIKNLKNESENNFDEIKKMISAMKADNLSFEIEKIDSILVNASKNNEFKNVEASIVTLSNRISGLTQQLASELTDNSIMENNLKSNELKLQIEKAEFNYKESENTKFLNYIEMKHDPNDFDTSFKLSFNIPFTQFDDYLKNSEIISLKIKEELFKIETKEKAEISRKKIANLKQNAKIISELNIKIENVNKALYKSKNKLPAKIQISLYDLYLELKLDLNEMLKTYFKSYFQILVDFNLIAKHQNDNLLSENWSTFAPGEKL